MRLARFFAKIETTTPWGGLVAAIERPYPKRGCRGRPLIWLERRLRIYITKPSLDNHRSQEEAG